MNRLWGKVDDLHHSLEVLDGGDVFAHWWGGVGGMGWGGVVRVGEGERESWMGEG